MILCALVLLWIVGLGMCFSAGTGSVRLNDGLYDLEGLLPRKQLCDSIPFGDTL